MKCDTDQYIAQPDILSCFRVINSSARIGGPRLLYHFGGKGRLAGARDPDDLDCSSRPARRKAFRQITPPDMLLVERRRFLDGDHLRPHGAQLEFKFLLIEPPTRLFGDIIDESAQVTK